MQEILKRGKDRPSVVGAGKGPPVTRVTLRTWYLAAKYIDNLNIFSELDCDPNLISRDLGFSDSRQFEEWIRNQCENWTKILNTDEVQKIAPKIATQLLTLADETDKHPA